MVFSMILKNNEISVAIEFEDSMWIRSQVLRDEFHSSIEKASSSELHLLSQWLSFLKVKGEQRILAISLNHLNNLISPQSIHYASRALEDRDFILATYHSLGSLSAFPKPALFEEKTNTIYAIFGGQGPNEDYLHELQYLFDVYGDYIGDLINLASKELDLPILKWLVTKSHPDVRYTASVPISLPLIGVTQLCQYYATCRILGLDPGQFRKYFKGVTGHSQGIVSAVVVSASNTLESFIANFCKGIKLLALIGTVARDAFPNSHIDPSIVKDTMELEGAPSAMLSISGIDQQLLQKHIDITNQYSAAGKIEISLFNSKNHYVVTGPPKSLYGLILSLRKVKADKDLDQSKIPHSKRKPTFNMRFLPVEVPFHSSYLSQCTELVVSKLSGCDYWKGSDLSIPVFHTKDDLRDLSNTLIESLCDQIFTLPIHWKRVTTQKLKATHFIDFGPGGLNGIGSLTNLNHEGTGAVVYFLGKNTDIFDTQNFHSSVSWAASYSPKLVKYDDGSMIIETALSRLTGKPPIWCCGMTPSTVSGDFVTAVTNSGYNIELAGGGHHTPELLRNKIKYIKSKIKPGNGIVLNSLYLNPRLWGFQYPLLCTLRKEGMPIEGLTIGAGVPSHEVAKEIILNLKKAGIKYVCMKPGSVEGIRSVISIAAANPDFPVMLQWTGGRGGGHHSYEDFHAPLISTYSRIREIKNLVLVVGSGFGSSKETFPYLTGEWALNYDLPLMPVDGILFGSRLMVAKECETSPKAKQAIIDAKGVADLDWERTYEKETGGIITVLSELGEPIHKIATRGVQFWKELDEKLFSLPREKQAEWIEQNKRYLIQRLNADFQKPFFAKKKDGTIPDSFSVMTYEEVLNRMIELMYVKHQQRWIDISYQKYHVANFLQRTEERFIQSTTKSIAATFRDSKSCPLEFLKLFVKIYPKCCEQLLASEDVEYFMALCMYPMAKPVPFIPVLDSKFNYWFKKDSLWQSEDLEAVVDQDVGRVCILHGPVAAQYSTRVDEPVKDLLDGINNGLIEQLLKRTQSQSIPVIENIGIELNTTLVAKTLLNNSVDYREIENTKYFTPTKKITIETWLQVLAGSEKNWLSCFLLAPYVVQGNEYSANPIHRLLRPKINSTVEISNINGYYNLKSEDGYLEVFATKSVINLKIFEKNVPLKFLFKYLPKSGISPIHEEMNDRNTRIKLFYHQLWFGEEWRQKLSVLDSFSCDAVVSKSDVISFCKAVNNFSDNLIRKGMVPVDYAIVLGWKAIIKALFAREIDGDLLNLVHLSNRIRILEDGVSLQIGDKISTIARIMAVKISDSGKIVRVTGTLFRNGAAIMDVTSEFMYRGVYLDFHNCFEEIHSHERVIEVLDKETISVLQAKPWITWNEGARISESSQLYFKIVSIEKFLTSSEFSDIKCKGSVYIKSPTRGIVEIGVVNEHFQNMKANPVRSFLERISRPSSGLVPLNANYEILLDNALGNEIRAPETNSTYAEISGDTNPIHVNSYIADLAGLPGTITHGMWTSAAVRKYLDVIFESDESFVKSYEVKFVGMVLPKDQLQIRLFHIGMKNGVEVIRIDVQKEDGETVLSGTAEVEQPKTGFLFTGQGSQEVGMGMDLYNSSAVAKAVWDNADKYLQETYSFSILEIVRNNPKTKVIHFRGYLGQQIRDRYMKMKYDTINEHGDVTSLALFPDITLSSISYTFSSPTGLLYSTQFAQIALVVMEKAAFEDLKSKGLVGNSITAFAGHSLGEYAALSSVADFIDPNALWDIVFYRGLTMQRAVKRDSQNRSNYAMCAVNPSRVHHNFSEYYLKKVVTSVSVEIGGLCEIVNYNVENQQYVVAGELIALETLSNFLNYLNVKKVDILELPVSKNGLSSKFKEILSVCHSEAKNRMKDGYIELRRGIATIPLAGIDIPFHSSHIWSGVGPFRGFISQKIDRKRLNVDLLVGKYIPNLTAKPFSLEKSSIEEIYKLTKSPKLESVLDDWDVEVWNSPSEKQKLGYIILVELLSYQFASPVRWIETQDVLLNKFKLQRLIEVGPSPVLTGMANKTLQLKYAAQDTATGISRSVLCISKNVEDIYYIYENAEEIVEPIIEKEKLPDPKISQSPRSLVAHTVKKIDDQPIDAKDVLLCIISQKLKKAPVDLPLSKSIKELVGGKSTLQNEIIGDLQAEFSSTPEKGEEIPLGELAATLNSQYTGKLGKYMKGLISRLISQKFPGGFPYSSVQAHLEKSWGLGPSRVEGVMVRCLTCDLPSRLENETAVKNWLDDVALLYAKEHGIDIKNSSQSSYLQTAEPLMNSEEFEKYKTEMNILLKKQIQIYMQHLGENSREGYNAYQREKLRSDKLQNDLDCIWAEHGESYIKRIIPLFNIHKTRIFDSSWNWVRQDALEMWYDMIFGRLSTIDREILGKSISIINRSTPALIQLIKFYISNCNIKRGKNYELAKDLATQLLANCEVNLNNAPRCKDVTYHTAPSTTITEAGDIVFIERNRPNVRKLESYVEEMAAGSKVGWKVDLQQIQTEVAKLYEVARQQPQISEASKQAIQSLYDEVIKSLNAGNSLAPAGLRRLSTSFVSPDVAHPISVADGELPYLHLKRNYAGDWNYSKQLTCVYLDILNEIATSGSSFQNTTALITGCGRGSIGVEVLKGLISGGCYVVVTTSSYSRKTVEYFQDIYHKFGARKSKLVVVPFNQGSKQDVKSLVDYIYDENGLNIDLDYLIPFAALSENGREIDEIDDLSELAHRLMLTNVIRLIGAVKSKKRAFGIRTRPTQIVVPQSPNHGVFGGDGLYAESKIGLEPLFNKWKSESWSQFISLVGAVIGWTRGTGLMNSSNIVAEGIEKHGVRTFSAKEMGFNILGLLHPTLTSIASVEPLWADLSGGMMLLHNLNDIVKEIRKDILQKAKTNYALNAESVKEEEAIKGILPKSYIVEPRANNIFEFPNLKSYEDLLENLQSCHSKKEEMLDLRGMIDLEKMAVIVGFAEIGPWGSSRTRWEMESEGELSIGGCLELARMMGFVKFFNGTLKSGQPYIGWIEKSTGNPITDLQIKKVYEDQILKHTGIRIIEPQLVDGYQPEKKEFSQELVLNHDLDPLETTEEEALQFKLKYDGAVDVWSEPAGTWFVKFKKGAIITVTKIIPFDRSVAGLVPTGWDARYYGVPQDIIDQVDRCTLWTIVATAEALATAGIADPYELYNHVHVTEVGIAVGSGMGGQTSLRGIFRGRYEGKDIQKDVLQESFINTTAGWINLLLLSASGPVKIPVGACATALQSLEIGIDTISSGKAKVMICGGVDDFTEEGSAEFANMKATSNSITELEKGRSPSEMSRPTTSSRAGFMEAQGCGVQILMQAKLAIELGLPIYGVLGLTNTAMDKEGRSVPAPGQGILGTAKEIGSGLSPRLSVEYRRRQMNFRKNQILEWKKNELVHIQESARSITSDSSRARFVEERVRLVQEECARQERDSLETWGSGFYRNDPEIAPLRGALASFGLGIDDVGVVSFHGTSTVANDENESDVTNKQFAHLGRTLGNGCPVIAQKWLTGHPKGAAAAWMCNGLMQCILSGKIPGNRNADNIASELEKFEYLLYPSRSLQTDGIKAGILKSFGFGQVGGEALLIHPNYLLSSLNKSSYDNYRKANVKRWHISYRTLQDALTHENLVKLKTSPPYSESLESSVYLNPLHRTEQKSNGEFEFKPYSKPLSNLEKVCDLIQTDSKGIGIDTEVIGSLPLDNDIFIQRNYTESEIAECNSRPDPVASFTGKWCAKEAVVKAITSFGVDALFKIVNASSDPLADIEILTNVQGVPIVNLTGKAKEISTKLKVTTIKVSISHSDENAVAIATVE